MHELVTVVLVPDLEMVECVGEGFDFFFALSNLAVEFITVPLDFLFFLCGFNYVVRLGSLLAVTFTLTSAGFVTLTQAFVFNS